MSDKAICEHGTEMPHCEICFPPSPVNTMTTDKTPELERIAKNFSESFVDTVTAQIGANAHDPKLFVQTLMRKMILQALREAATPLIEENERLKKGLEEAEKVMGAPK